MGFFSEDMLPMLGTYQAETTELMGSVDAIAARVEREGSLGPQDIAELFRCAHTIKGSSAMMGLEGLATLTHRLEDLFDLLRGDPSLAEGKVPEILDILYSFGDYVSDEVGRMEDADFVPADAGGLAERIDACAAALTGEAEGSPAEAVAPVAKGEKGVAAAAAAAGASAGLAEGAAATGPLPGAVGDASSATASDPADAGATSILKVSFKPDVAMVNARALVITRQLAKQVGLRSFVPEDLTDPESSKVIAQEGLLLVLDAGDIERARGLLAKNSFVRRLETLEAAEAAAVEQSREQPEGKVAAASAAEKYVTLRWSSVRELQDLVGEFLSHVVRLRALADAIPDDGGLRTQISNTARLVEGLAYHVDRMAMVSMSVMVPQLSRMVRDMCRSSGKRVSFEVHGGSIDIDRNLYNSIADPLLHIIRNAVDHGIEPPEERLAAGKEERGTVTLSIENLGARVAFRVSDDGRGIDVDAVLDKAASKGLLDRPRASYTREEALRMVMAPGLSTSSAVTQYSGRGVGMDVVSTVVRDFNGSVDIESQPGQGTAITLFMPVSVTSVECLGLRIGPTVCHSPLFNLSKIFTAADAAERLTTFEGSMLFEHEKRQLPVLDMHRLLGCAGSNAFYVVCRSLEEEFVIGVDDVVGEYGCASKPLPSCLGTRWQDRVAIRNVTIMDDGQVGYVLNAPLMADFAQGRRRLPDDDEDAGGRDAAPEAFSAAAAGSAAPPASAFVFRLGDDLYAVPVDKVVRIVPLARCSAVPRGLPYLLGLANDRNHVIAVFDLARSAGAHEESPYVLIVDGGQGDGVGLTISSAIGIRDLSHATPLDEQAEPRALAAGLRTTLAVRDHPKRPPITLLSW